MKKSRMYLNLQTLRYDNRTQSNLACAVLSRYKLLLTLLLTIICLTLTVSGCSPVSGGDKADKMLINHLLDDIEDAVAQYKPNDVIDLLHRDYLHNGKFKTNLTHIWQERMLLYYSLTMDDRVIHIRNNQAVVHFRMIFMGDDQNIVSNEPSEEYGDLSYLIKENGKWYLYGNRQ